MADVDSMHARHHDAIAGEAAGWMAAAGAAIGFALNGLSNAKWDTALLLAGLAVLLWCGSFAAGIFRQAVHTATLQASLLAAAFGQAGVSPAEIKPMWEEHQRRAASQVKWRRWQLWLLFAGALVYLAMQMQGAWERSHDKAAAHCGRIEARMLSNHPGRTDLPSIFQALGCQAQGESNVFAPQSGSVAH